jgi:hypothetical protein
MPMTSIESLAEARKRPRAASARKKFDELYPDSDDTFAYIAGYTAGGFPYGTTWEELGEEPLWTEDENIEPAGAKLTRSMCS